MHSKVIQVHFGYILTRTWQSLDACPVYCSSSPTIFEGLHSIVYGPMPGLCPSYNPHSGQIVTLKLLLYPGYVAWRDNHYYCVYPWKSIRLKNVTINVSKYYLDIHTITHIVCTNLSYTCSL